MDKIKTYRGVRFTADVVQQAYKVFLEQLPQGHRNVNPARRIETADETRNYDSDEIFFAAYRKAWRAATFRKYSFVEKVNVGMFGLDSRAGNCTVTVASAEDVKIERVFEVFESHLETSRLPEPATVRVKPTIFIGHGRSQQWRDLKDHLQDKHEYSVIAYEVGERAGHTIRDILQDLLEKTSFALLVLTAEDETSEGGLRARQNVIHELGLFQGKLGFPRAIALVEDGTELLSNIQGIQQLCFAPGNIASVYGDVIAVLRREFGDVR